MTRSRILLLLAAVPLAPAIVLTVLAFRPSSLTPLVLLTSFVPYAGLLYLVALVLATAAVVLARAPHQRRTPFLVAVALVAPLALHGWWYVDAGRAVDEPIHGPMTVMTLNLRLGNGDPERVVELVEANDVDVLALVEVTPAARTALEGAGLLQRLAYVAGEEGPGASGTLLLSRFPLSDVERVPTALGTWAATVTTPGQRAIGVIAAHTIRPQDGVERWYAEHARLRTAARVRIEDGPGTVVVLGDLNATPDHEVLDDHADAGLRRAARLTGDAHQPTWPAEGHVRLLGIPVPSLLTIDHVLLGPGLTASSTATATVAGTDHRALVARVGRTPMPAP